MIVETIFNGRPAQVMYMTTDFEPVDNELLATLVKVTFLDDEGGALFLVPKSHTDMGFSGETEAAREERRAAQRVRARQPKWLQDMLAAKAFDPNQPRDEDGKWTSGGGGAGSSGGATPATPAPLAPPSEPSTGSRTAQVRAKAEAGVAAGAAMARAAGVRPLQGSDGHPNIIASRNISAVRLQAENRDKFNRPDVVAMRTNPLTYTKDVGLFSNGNFYPNLRASDIVTAPEGASEEQRMAAADKTVENVKAHMKENLRVLWNESGATGQENNKVWYDGARNIVNDQVAEYGLNDASVAGVYAALSPQKDWDQNVYLGDAVLDIYQNKQDHPWNAEMAATAKEIWTKPRQQKILPNVIGRSLAECEGPTEKAMWIRTYDQTYSERQFRSVNADGTRGDVVRNLDGTPTTAAWPPLPMISNAVKSIEANGDPARLSEAMGTQHKVRSFFNNILDPNSQNGDVTIDTHAVGAALLRPVGNSHVTYIQASAGSLERKKQPEGYQAASGSVETGSYGLYPIYADAVRELATDLGVQPRQLQSVTWEMKRALFPRTTTDQQKLQVEAAWHAYREDPSITLADTQARILEIARRRS